MHFEIQWRKLFLSSVFHLLVFQFNSFFFFFFPRVDWFAELVVSNDSAGLRLIQFGVLNSLTLSRFDSIRPSTLIHFNPNRLASESSPRSRWLIAPRARGSVEIRGGYSLITLSWKEFQEEVPGRNLPGSRTTLNKKKDAKKLSISSPR